MMQRGAGSGVDGWAHREREFIELLTNTPPPAHCYLLRTLVQFQPHACCVHCCGEVLCANFAFLKLAGWDGADGRHLDEIAPRDRLPHVWERVETHASGAYDTVVLSARNGWRLVHVEPVEVTWDSRRARLILVQPLARLLEVEWVTGGVSVTV